MYDCIIIGAGPSGVIASIYLKRAGFSILLIEKNEIGGLIRNAYRIENYLGFNSISGIKYSQLMKNQLKKNKIEIVYDEIKKVNYNNKYIISSENNIYVSKCLLIATGSKPKLLNKKLLSSDKINNKIYYHITDLPSGYKNSIIGILGGGDVAFDYALNLFKNGLKVKILVRNKPKCLDNLMNKVLDSKIEIINNIEIKTIVDNKDKLLLYTNNDVLEVDMLLIAIGREKNDINTINKNNNNCFKIGDLSNIEYRQLSIACGDAILKSMKIEKYLKIQKEKNGNN